jgi:hypothetical protein
MRQLLLGIMFLPLAVAGWSAGGPVDRVGFVWLDTTRPDPPTAAVTPNDDPGVFRG